MAIHYKKTLDSYQAKRGVFRVIDVPTMKYLMVDGSGDPNSAPEYSDAVTALFSVAYKLKFAAREQVGIDAVVMPLEGLWHAPDMEAFTTRRDKSAWLWTLLIMVPDHVTDAMYADAVAAVGKKKDAPAALERLRLEELREGKCVQTLHVGPFDYEGPVLDDLHNRFIPENGLTMRGLHHEIYLSDIRRTDPARLRTVLRQPVS